MIALEAKYHAKCLVAFYNKASRADTSRDSDRTDAHLHGIAFAQLVAYMEDFRKAEDTAPVFKLTSLVDLNTTRLKQLGASVHNRIHNTRLKIRLLSAFPDLTAHTDGRGILLTFDQTSRILENIPPTQTALEQHIKRARYQCHCWNMCLSSDPQLPNPSDWGWSKVLTEWQPLWTTLPEASKSCYELIHCACKKGCRGQCKCVKAVLKCTSHVLVQEIVRTRNMIFMTIVQFNTCSIGCPIPYICDFTWCTNLSCLILTKYEFLKFSHIWKGVKLQNQCPYIFN